MELTYEQMKKLLMYGGELEVVDTDDDNLVNIVVTIPMDRWTAAHVIEKIENCTA